jgi:tetratricopeptide (TPR) repeat protein
VFLAVSAHRSLFCWYCHDFPHRLPVPCRRDCIHPLFIVALCAADAKRVVRFCGEGVFAGEGRGGAPPKSAAVRARKLTPEQKADIEKTLEKALAFFKEGNVPKAAQLIGLASDLDPSIEPPGIMMAKWAALGGNMPVARQLLDTAVVAHPEDPEPFILLADIARMEGRRTEAMLLLGRGQELLEKYSANAERKAKIAKSMWSNLAYFAETQNNIESALACLKKLEALDPSSAETQLRIGNLYFKRGKAGDEKLAVKTFEKAFKLDPQQFPPPAYLAQIYLRNGDAAKAVTLLDEALKAYPKHVGVLAFAANYYLSKGDVGKAKQYADSLEQLEPDSAAVHSLQGTLALYRKDAGSAEAEFRKALEKSPGDSEVVNSLALALLEQEGDEKVKEGLALAEANIRRNSSQVTATTLAWALYRAGNFESCYRLLDQILSRQQLSSDGAYFVASILVHKGNAKDAAKLLKATLQSEIPFFKRADAEELLKSLTADAGTTGAK